MKSVSETRLPTNTNKPNKFIFWKILFLIFSAFSPRLKKNCDKRTDKSLLPKNQPPDFPRFFAPQKKFAQNELLKPYLPQRSIKTLHFRPRFPITAPNNKDCGRFSGVKSMSRAATTTLVFYGSPFDSPFRLSKRMMAKDKQKRG